MTEKSLSEKKTIGFLEFSFYVFIGWFGAKAMIKKG